jgi:HEAT repeat protein
LTSDSGQSGPFEFPQIEAGSRIEALPDTLDDGGLADALLRVTSESVVERTEAVKNLAQYLTRTAVNALISCSHLDPESTIRALAVSSLASIDHESVFPAVLIGMADEAREVRAAAARALTRLNFDRSEAYVHLIQTAEPIILITVAQACIKAGILSQNLDRLASGDRRQAYEAFVLVSLLAKAKMINPIIDAIEHHRDRTARIATIKLLASTGDAQVLERLQKLASKDDLDEEVKTAVLEGIYKLEQSRPKKPEAVDDLVVHNHQEDELERVEKEETVDQIATGSAFNEGTEVGEYKG